MANMAIIERHSYSDISTPEAPNSCFYFQTPNMTQEDWDRVVEKNCAHTLELQEPIIDAIQETLYHTNHCNFAPEYNFSSEITHSDEKSLLEQKAPRVSKICASLLEIGLWQITSKYEEHVVAKCHFATRKLSWEILEGGLKMKIEIKWEQISSMKVVLENDQPGVLEVELNEPPLFFVEMEPEPRKHSCWINIADFTQGQAATYCRRHFLLFPPGALDTHFEKLTQFEPRFREMCQSSSPCHENPHFPSDHDIGQNISLDCNGNGSEMNSPQESPHSKGFNNIGAIVPFDSYGNWPQGNSVQQSLCLSDPMPLSPIQEDHQQNYVDQTTCSQQYLPISRISPTSDLHMGGNISFNGNGNDPELISLQESSYWKDFHNVSTAIFPYGNNGHDPQINPEPHMNSFQPETCSIEPTSFSHIRGDYQQNDHVHQIMCTQPIYNTTSDKDHSWNIDEIVTNITRGNSSSMGVWDQQMNNAALMEQGNLKIQEQFPTELPKISEESPIVPDQMNVLQSNYGKQLGLNGLQSFMPDPLPDYWNMEDLNAGFPPLGSEHQRDANENNGGQFHAEPIRCMAPEYKSIGPNFGPNQTTEEIVGNQNRINPVNSHYKSKFF